MKHLELLQNRIAKGSKLTIKHRRDGKSFPIPIIKSGTVLTSSTPEIGEITFNEFDFDTLTLKDKE